MKQASLVHIQDQLWGNLRISGKLAAQLDPEERATVDLTAKLIDNTIQAIATGKRREALEQLSDLLQHLEV